MNELRGALDEIEDLKKKCAVYQEAIDGWGGDAAAVRHLLAKKQQEVESANRRLAKRLKDLSYEKKKNGILTKELDDLKAKRILQNKRRGELEEDLRISYRAIKAAVVGLKAAHADEALALVESIMKEAP